MKRVVFLIMLGLSACPSGRGNAAETPTVADTIKAGRDKSKIVLQGKVSKAISLDVFVLNDGTGDVLLDMTGQKKIIKPGDAIAVFGIFRTHPALRKYEGEIKAIDVADASNDAAVRALIEKAPKPAKTQDAPVPAPTFLSVPRDTASRLQELEQLKTKGLITPDEYQEQRKRILSEL